ncbi:amino acid adenylation domain-containing protein [Streptomyces sp. SID6648]|nr:amino acid adenylation domain-containing protein [Streptomyces sp. SID6648]
MRAHPGSVSGPLRPLPDLFAEQAARTPDAPAVLGDGERLTYAELARDAGRLAGRLAAMGVGPGDRVGVCVPHSPDLVVALLGVLMAGAAYVPLDIDYPARRLEFVIADTGLRHVVVDRRTAGRRPTGEARPIPVRDAADAEPGHLAVPISAGPEDVACVIHTSGSTGQPKGVLIPHRALSNLALAAGEEFALAPGETMLANKSAGFSGSLEELFPPLVHGATVVLPGNRVALSSVDELLTCLEHHGVTVLILTTALWHLVVRELAQRDARFSRSVRLVCVTGERCRPELLSLWPRLGVRLVHIYGPTEYTATVTYFSLPAGASVPDGEALPIGTPIRDTRVHILDSAMRPVADGDSGELYVGGASLALGYDGRPDLTAERFVPDPFSPSEPRAHLYRTGDRVRRRPDGNLEFIGRLDDQLKILGHRIEPAEIESVLARQTSVRQSVVTAHESAEGRRRLVAYIVAADGDAIVDDDLRSALAAELPAYMVPTAYVRIPEIPLTHHRKIDRNALPEPPALRPALATAYRAPAGRTESYLCALWAELLGLDAVGVDDPWTALGGDSLLAQRVLGRIRADVGRSPRPRDVLAAPTVHALAALVDDAPGHTGRPALAIAARARQSFTERLAAREGPTLLGPLAENQRGIWFHSLLAPRSALYNTPWTCRLSGDLDHAALRAAFATVVSRHESLRTAFVSIGGEPAQVAGAVAELTAEDLREHPDPETLARNRAAALAVTPINVARGPLLRMHLLRTGDRDHHLVCTAHHLVLDGRSQQILLRDLAEEYGRESGLGGARRVLTPTRHVDFAAWQQSYLASAEATEHLDWWAQALADVRPLALGPGERTSGQGASERRIPDETGRFLDFGLGGPEELRRVASTAGVTHFAVLLAAFVAQLRRESGRNDIAVGTPVSGRTLPQMQDTVGMFVNSVVVRTRCPDGAGFPELLDAVRESALDAFAHQDVPLDRVVERVPVAKERRVGDNPFFNVLFSYERDACLGLDWPGLTLGAARDLPTGTAKADLVLTVTEHADHLQGRLEYRTARADGNLASRIAEGMARTLRDLGSERGED